MAVAFLKDPVFFNDSKRRENRSVYDALILPDRLRP